MVRLAIDFEFPSRVWWESGGQELWDALVEDFDGGGVIVDADLATSWLAQAEQIRGWSEGPDYAPHPVRRIELAADDADL
jgi:hypothetical protein